MNKKSNPRHVLALRKWNLFGGDAVKFPAVRLVDKDGFEFYWRYEYDAILDEKTVVLLCDREYKADLFGVSLEAFTAGNIYESMDIMKTCGIKIVELY